MFTTGILNAQQDYKHKQQWTINSHTHNAPQEHSAHAKRFILEMPNNKNTNINNQLSCTQCSTGTPCLCGLSTPGIPNNKNTTQTTRNNKFTCKQSFEEYLA